MGNNNKPRLSIGEIRELIQYVKSYGGSYSMVVGNHSYNIDDVYEQYLYNQDALMHVLDEVILRKGRL